MNFPRVPLPFVCPNVLFLLLHLSVNRSLGIRYCQGSSCSKRMQKKVVVEDGKEDRISALPIYVIDLILARLPARCAARTSILSSKWRYNWAMHPNLVLDEQFLVLLAVKSPSYFKQTVDEILLRHRGDMVKFALGSVKPNRAKALFPSHSDIDRWVDFVTRNGVKELTLAMPFDIRYKLPSCVFNCLTITNLKLDKSVIKPPMSFLDFPNLRTLSMTNVTIDPATECYVFKSPRLVILHLIYCDVTQYLNIVSPKFVSLYLSNSHYLVLNCFINCNNLRMLRIRCDKLVDVLEPVERSTLKKFFFQVAHTVQALDLDSVLLDLCCADKVLKMLPFSVSCLLNLSLIVDFRNLSRTSGALQLIKSAPNLNALTIWVNVDGAAETAEAVSKYLKTPACLDRPLNKLKRVTLASRGASESKLAFTKLLISRTPSLVRMHILGYKNTGYEELLHFPRASSQAELIIT